MLVIKVELWPGGHRHAAREIGRMGIANISALATVSDYVAVRHDDTNATTAILIPGHRRADGFWPLIARAAHPAPDREAATAVVGWPELVAAIEQRILEDPGSGERP